MGEVGCAERTPSEARSADDLYIGVRSALIYQKLRNFSVNINKINNAELRKDTQRVLPFFRKKACAEKLKLLENKKCYLQRKIMKNFT